MVSNDAILNVIADNLEFLGYSITFEDIAIDKADCMGIYLTDAGDGTKTIDGKLIQVKDLGIRLHGNTQTGSIKKCSEDMVRISKKLTISNATLSEFKILACSVRNSGSKDMGRTSKEIPVSDIHFLIQYESIM